MFPLILSLPWKKAWWKNRRLFGTTIAHWRFFVNYFRNFGCTTKRMLIKKRSTNTIHRGHQVFKLKYQGFYENCTTKTVICAVVGNYLMEYFKKKCSRSVEGRAHCSIQSEYNTTVFNRRSQQEISSKTRILRLTV